MRKDLPSFWNAPALRASGWRFLRRPGLLPSTSATCCLLSGVLCSSAAWWGNTADAFVLCAWFSSWLQLVTVSWLLSAAWLCTDRWRIFRWSDKMNRCCDDHGVTCAQHLDCCQVMSSFIFTEQCRVVRNFIWISPFTPTREQHLIFSYFVEWAKLGLHAQCPNRVKLIAQQKRQQFLHFQHTTIFFGAT